jgi:Tryptophan-associated transmembrane protein (Trp_oprn_chp)
VTATDVVEVDTVALLRGRRGLTAAAIGCALSGGMVLLAAGRVWVHYSVTEQALSPRAASATGHAVAQAAGTFALVVLAGVLVLPATRGFGRRIAGLLIAGAGAGIGYLAVMTIAAPAEQLPGRASSPAVTGWPWVALVAGLVAVGAGLLSTISSGEWPAMGRRYESGAATRSRPATDASMWDRLDEGDDPTA